MCNCKSTNKTFEGRQSLDTICLEVKSCLQIHCQRCLHGLDFSQTFHCKICLFKAEQGMPVQMDKQCYSKKIITSLSPIQQVYKHAIYSTSILQELGNHHQTYKHNIHNITKFCSARLIASPSHKFPYKNKDLLQQILPLLYRNPE